MGWSEMPTLSLLHTFPTRHYFKQSIRFTSWLPHQANRISSSIPPKAFPDNNAYDILGLLPSQTQLNRATVRAAYLQKMKLIHPDVNRGIDTTEDAIQLNKAYQTLLNTCSSIGDDDDDGNLGWNTVGDVFDTNKTTPPTTDDCLLFVNPFAFYNINPLDWEKLQEVVAGCETETEAVEALVAAGAAPTSQEGDGGAVVIVNQAQLGVLITELGRMSDAMDTVAIETAQYFIFNCLARKRRMRG